MPKDYLMDSGFDLMITDGDFTVGESTNQHQNLLLLHGRGSFRQYPLTGVGILNYLNDDNAGDLYQEVQKQFEADGMKVRKLIINSDGSVTIEAEYGS